MLWVEKAQKELDVMNKRPDFPLKVFPRLETERLILRELADTDAEAYFQVCSEYEWLRLWGFPVHSSPKDTLAMIRQQREAYEAGLQLRWGIALRGINKVIGSICLYRFVVPHFRAEVTYEQARAVSGNGYMTEALRAVVRFGFEELDLHTIEAGIDPGHAGSLRVAERVGFQREGYLRENFFFEGRFYDTILCTMMSGRPSTRPWKK